MNGAAVGDGAAVEPPIMPPLPMPPPIIPWLPLSPVAVKMSWPSGEYTAMSTLLSIATRVIAYTADASQPSGAL